MRKTPAAHKKPIQATGYLAFPILCSDQDDIVCVGESEDAGILAN